MAVSQPKHVAYKLTKKFCHIIDYICCVLDGNKHHFKNNIINEDIAENLQINTTYQPKH